MVSWTWLRVAALAAMAVPSYADTAHIYTMDDVASWQLQYEMTVQLSAPSADILDMTYTVVPLTTALGLNRSSVARESVNIPGDLVLVTHTNYNNITSSSQIAYLCCDDLNNSFTDPDSMLETLMANSPKAILLYSQEGNCCGLKASSLSYETLFTMAYSSDAAQALNMTSSGDGVIQATISGNTTSTDSQTGSNGTSNSAIAMSILYSITGLITALFLIIIATGAIRAHRYPDRYGPRSGHGGRTRQSRARGLARAVLETLPIVKFGDPAPAKPDLGTELESQSSSEPGVETINLAVPNAQAHHLSSIPEDAVPQPKGTANVTSVAAVDVAAAAAAAAAGPEQNTADATKAGADSTAQSDDDHLGCSICTEDFLVGEDVRVLPCNHKFHPTCVDPWLVNVSGTCPLCRMDLRPKDEQGDSRPSTAGTNLPPPLEDDEAAAAAAAIAAESSASGQHRHRSSRLFDLNRLRHASAEERIEALRRYRSETQSGSYSTHAATSTNGGDEHSRSVTLTRRLRDKFHIRTHAQSSG